MKKTLLGIFLVFSIITLIGCQSSEEDEEVSPSTDSRTTVVSNSLIDIPSSVSASSSSSSSNVFSTASFKEMASEDSTADEHVLEVYEGIRQNIGAMEEWSSLIRSFTRVIYEITGRSESGDWTNSSPSAGEPSRIVWGPDSTNGYDSKMELYFDGEKGFEAYLTVNETEKTAKGAYTWDFAVTPNDDDPDSEAKVQFIFDSTATDGTKEMSIKVEDMNGTSTSGPENAWLKVTQNTSNVITLWGNYYFPNLGWFGDVTADARNYVFAVAGYDETGQSEELKNMAVMQLALPESDATSDFWDSASVSAVFVDKLRQAWSNYPLLTVAGIELWTGIDLSPASTIDELTDAQIIAILEWARDNAGETGASNFAELLYVSNLVNPAYFDEDGFQGTCYDPDSDGTCDQGTATTVPSGFDSLDIESVADDVEAPATVKNLSVDFL
jgi:hypothetical protein